MAIQLVLGNEVDVSTRDLGQPLRQWQALRKDVVSGRKIDKKVDIAVGSFFPTRDRAEYPDASGAELSTRRGYHLAFCMQCF